LIDCRRNESSTPGFILRQFYVRRALRIFPLFLLTIAVLVIVNVAPFANSWPWHASYLSNLYFYNNGFSGNGIHFWTLAVEEQFYLVFPLLILFLPNRYLLHCLITLFVSAPLFRATFGTEQNWLLLPSSLDSLGCGALLAWLRHAGSKRQPGVATTMLAVGLILYIVCHLSGQFGVLKKTCVALVCAWAVWNASKGAATMWGNLLENPYLRAVGRVSYGIYVIHAFAPLIWNWIMYSAPIPGYRVMMRLGVPAEYYSNPVSERLAWVGLTTGLVLLSYRFVEVPLNGLKRHFPYIAAT
jgi:peptidoglycan/LPS O-acetylase OafA/YrhL